jgi:N-hydroxyarylamine O-acetyltransferase
MIEDYLRLLGVAARPGLDGSTSVELLSRLHRAHVERVAYTNLCILLGRPGSTDQQASARRILRGGGGYCFHLNGALGWLLERLGFRVTMHRGYVASDEAWSSGPAEVKLNHLALVVHDLPTRACPSGSWLVDAGLGDALHDPLPLVVGEHRQGPFTFVLGPAAGREGWRLRHHHAGSFGAMEFEAEPVTLAAFSQAHDELSTSAGSPFTGVFTAQRRDAEGVDVLRGCSLIRIDGSGRTERDVTDPNDWTALVRDRFGLSVELAATLWPRVSAAHLAWLARRDRAPLAAAVARPAVEAAPADAVQGAATR